MKTTTLIIMTLLLFSSQITAAEPDRMSRSAGTLLNIGDLSLEEKLRFSPANLTTADYMPRNFEAEAVTASRPYHPVDYGSPVVFKFFDAHAETTVDLDGDGYFHRLKISFDADVNSAQETVYAKLYLSHEGGDWQPCATSDLFEISYDSAQDGYQVITELLEGYEPGYYDVLIELHSLYHTGVVANRIISNDSDGYVLALEDLEHDDYYTDELYSTHYESYAATGGFNLFSILILGLIFILKFLSTLNSADFNCFFRKKRA